MSLLEKYLWKILRKSDSSYHSLKTSFSQQGEDLIIDFIFTWMLDCTKPSYLDIGANHPSYLNNTYLFYKKGCTGINIEPDPTLFNFIKKKRKKDVNIQIGVAEKKNILDFYIMETSTLNTFSKEVAIEYSQSERFGKPQIKEVRKINVLPINDILEKYFILNNNYFISIDVEGLDFEILSSINFKKYRPAVICIETDSLIQGINLNRYNTLMEKYDYIKYADNSINSIYIDKLRLNKFYERNSS